MDLMLARLLVLSTIHCKLIWQPCEVSANFCYARYIHSGAQDKLLLPPLSGVASSKTRMWDRGAAPSAALVDFCCSWI